MLLLSMTSLGQSKMYRFDTIQDKQESGWVSKPTKGCISIGQVLIVIKDGISIERLKIVKVSMLGDEFLYQCTDKNGEDVTLRVLKGKRIYYYRQGTYKMIFLI